jgi:hypothetical protein
MVKLDSAERICSDRRTYQAISFYVEKISRYKILAFSRQEGVTRAFDFCSNVFDHDRFDYLDIPSLTPIILTHHRIAIPLDA